jgi:16S rRNA (cytosine1402-N4)-methyltransferase
MLRECLDGLITHPDGIYIDGTLGGGGHSKAILDQLSATGTLFSVDQDDEAIAAASAYIGEDPRFNILKGNFGYLTTLLPPQYHGQVAGILLDLGVSTHQIKAGDRGFSFQEDGPLDMRMGNLTGLTAYEVVNNYEYEQLRDIIFHYGEEKASRKIARSIIDHRPVETTQDLRKAITEVVNPKFEVKSLARVFQAIRIEVNQELEVLKDVLKQSLEVLQEGGRLVVMSYHSLEDRLVKRFLKAGNFEGKVEKDFYGNNLSPFSLINKQVIIPSELEVANNPAARSAKLRTAEKINGGGS